MIFVQSNTSIRTVEDRYLFCKVRSNQAWTKDGFWTYPGTHGHLSSFKLEFIL
jgi:hypothetical protein